MRRKYFCETLHFVARYRIVETRFWTDAKVRALSKPQPCGLFLLFRLMTGPETIIIPGVIVTTRAGLAEKLGWDAKGFGKAFAELSREGWAKADWDAGLVWIPNGIKHNSPANPNVVKGWAKEWPEIPECPLKGEILQALREHIEGLGEGFAKAFAERFPDGYRNQEQDTGTGYRKQEQELVLAPAEPAKPKQPTDADRVWQRLNDLRKALMPKARVLKLSAKQRKAITERIAESSFEDAIDVLEHLAEKCRRNPAQLQWFNGVTPFRPDNYARTLGQLGTSDARGCPEIDLEGFDPMEARRQLDAITGPV